MNSHLALLFLLEVKGICEKGTNEPVITHNATMQTCWIYDMAQGKRERYLLMR
jgi:hypothetical protein